MAQRLEPGTLPTTILRHLSDGACLTIDALEESLGLSRRQISDGAAKLIFRGYVERIEVGCYQLTGAGKKAQQAGEVITSGPWKPDTVVARKPFPTTFRQRVWTAMRMSASFTIGDLVMAAARPEDRDAISNAGRYLRALKDGGYVAELPRRQTGTRLTSNGFKRFRLIRDTGPLAPVYRPTPKTLYDHNTREDVPCGRIS